MKNFFILWQLILSQETAEKHQTEILPQNAQKLGGCRYVSVHRVTEPSVALLSVNVMCLDSGRVETDGYCSLMSPMYF